MTGQKNSEPADGALGRQDRSVHAAKSLPKGPETVSLRDEIRAKLEEHVFIRALANSELELGCSEGWGVFGLDEAADSILSLLPPKGWRPIESAPKDGTSLLMFVPGFGMGTFILFWADGGWREPANHLRLKVEPTHFMPLPAAPVTKTEGGGK